MMEWASLCLRAEASLVQCSTGPAQTKGGQGFHWPTIINVGFFNLHTCRLKHKCRFFSMHCGSSVLSTSPTQENHLNFI